MFGNKSKPSKIYKYGMPGGVKSLIRNAELVEKQMSSAHKYRNNLVRLERDRRDEVEKKIQETFPKLVKLEKQIVELEKKIEEVRTQIKQKNAKERRRRRTREQSARIKGIQKDLKELRRKRKEARKKAFGSAKWKKIQKKIDDWTNSKGKELRKESGLYWGTYLTVEQSLSGARSGAPPKFKRWDGDGKLALQIQRGMPIAEAFAGKSTKLRIEEDPLHSTKNNRRVIVWMRIGSEGRDPVWACCRCTLHRDFPRDEETGEYLEDCKIKWVYLIRRRIATNYKWFVEFVISTDEKLTPKNLAKSGTVGVNLGWRRVRDGLRVATWVGDDGRSGQVVLDPFEFTSYTKTFELQAIRDRHFNGVTATLNHWKKNNGERPAWIDDHLSWLSIQAKQAKGKELKILKKEKQAFSALKRQWPAQADKIPDWLFERTARVTTWRSAARLASVILHWRENRFAGDEAIFNVLEAWRKRDRHLVEWERNQHRKTTARRDERYRRFCAELREQYHKVALADTDWKKVQRRALPEENEQTGARQWMRLAAVGRFSRFLKESGMAVAECDSQYITQRCNACKEITGIDAAASIYHTCPHCGIEFDQDENAAKNLLELASDDPPAAAEAA